jgi:putative glycosyltransferase (TIGR04372 family)
MILRRLRKSLKLRLKNYPVLFRLYRGISWALTRSPFGSATKRLVPKIANGLFPMWITPRCGLAYYYAGIGQVQKAVNIADDVLARKPDLYDSRFSRIAAVYSLQGRYEDAYRLFERMEQRCYEVARELQYDRLGLRLFPAIGFSAIGHLGMLDKYTKAELLGMLPKRTNLILGSPEDFSNPAYVRYWERYFSLISNPKTISTLAPLTYPLQAHLDVVRVGEHARRYFGFARDVQLQWEAEVRGPLLKLSEEHRERGYRLLRYLGVPEGVWFVGLHVREGTDRMRDLRNADITTYRLAVQEIGKRGGWVLRMGDRNMRPLPIWPNTIDYAHSSRREDWMDVFLWAEGRFFIGTGSGPQLIPPTFGRPVVIANYGPICTLVCSKDDILLPKHYWNENTGRPLTIQERVSSDYRTLESVGAFAKMGIKVIDNTPEELSEAVAEMINQLTGDGKHTEQEHLLQARFAELAASHDFYPGRIARAFISRCPEIF